MQFGQIWWANVDPVIDHEQAGRRPVAIVSAAWRDASPAPVVAVAGSAGLTVDSYLMPEQLRYVDRRRLESRTGTLPAEILQALRTIIGRMLC